MIAHKNASENNNEASPVDTLCFHSNTKPSKSHQCVDETIISSLETQLRPCSKRKHHHMDSTKIMTEKNFEKTRFKDIIGHGAVKLRLDELLLPLALPERLTRTVLVGIRALPASILLYGPPGCGKTQLARAIAGEARAAFYSVAPSDIMSKFVGESEAAIRNTFRQALAQAEHLESKCTVIFWDEIDALGRARRSSVNQDDGVGDGNDDCSRRILAELLIELNKLTDNTSQFHEDHTISTSQQCSPSIEDTCEEPLNIRIEEEDKYRSPRLLIVGATNRPEDCDPALLRRFGIRCFVGPPSHKDRRKMLQKALEDVSHNLQISDFSLLANLTDKWSGCDLQNMAREAAMAPVRECIRAAVLRRKEVAQQDICGTTSQETNPDTEAQLIMMQGLQKLRPVTVQDFAFALEFVLMKQDDSHIRGIHYDSSSDEDDDDE